MVSFPKEEQRSNSSGSRAGRYIADFDSASSMVVAVGSFLKGEERPPSPVPPLPSFLAAALNALPRKAREYLYQLGGTIEALHPDEADEVMSDEISRWVVGHYPRRSYSTVILGSANGAGAHLAASLGAPVLPQTMLIPIRRKCDPDAMKHDLEWGREVGQTLAETNPECRVFQMHDPIQDRLMVQVMGYFRLKRVRLGSVYEQFMLDTLVKNSTILILECNLEWPVTKVSDVQSFQVGGFGGLEEHELVHGSERLFEFLRHHGSDGSKWDPPKATGRGPEAEWGFQPELLDDVRRFARVHGFRVRRLQYISPDDLSPLVADLYSEWYKSRHMRADKLLVECFALLEPVMAVKTGSVPYWLAFNTQPSANCLERFLGERDRFDEIHLMLMSNGIMSAGIAPVDQWKRILGQATKRWTLLGMNQQKYPLDLGSFGRYHAELKKRLPIRYPLPENLDWTDVDRFLQESQHTYPNVELLKESC